MQTGDNVSVTIDNTLKDKAGNQLTAPVSVQFAYAGENIGRGGEAPEVLNIVYKKTNEFNIVFSKRIAADTVASNIQLRKEDGSSSVVIAGTVSLNADRKTATITPNETLIMGEEYSILVSTLLTDDSGQAINEFLHRFVVLNEDMFIYEKGNENLHTAGRIGNNHLFQGRTYEPENGLYYYRHRYYLPRIGRFLQTDPMGYKDSMNPYQAFGMNPANFSDPMGLGIVKAEFGKHDLFKTQDIRTGNKALDYTVVGAFNELRNTAALGINFVFNFLGTADDVAWDGVDYAGSKIGTNKRGELRDDAQLRQFVDAVLLVNGKGIKSGTEMLVSKLDELYDLYRVWRNTRRSAKALNKYRNSQKSIFIAQRDFSLLSSDELAEAFGAGPGKRYGVNTVETPWGARDLSTGKWTNGGRSGIDPVDDFIAHAEANGFEVLGREIRAKTPFGDRLIDVVLKKGDFVGAVEIKSSLKEFLKFNKSQFVKDRYINLFGAKTFGQVAREAQLPDIKSSIKILWEVK